jgi:hypothetical protein
LSIRRRSTASIQKRAETVKKQEQRAFSSAILFQANVTISAETGHFVEELLVDKEKQRQNIE